MIDSIGIIIFLILIHWVGDFVLQTHFMSIKKSSSNYYLSLHVLIYSLTTILAWCLFLPCMGYKISFYGIMLSFMIIFISHWVTDYFTSRVTSKLYKEEKIHNFFVIVGFDQVLHYTQILLTFYYIIK